MQAITALLIITLFKILVIRQTIIYHKPDFADENTRDLRSFLPLTKLDLLFFCSLFFAVPFFWGALKRKRSLYLFKPNGS